MQIVIARHPYVAKTNCILGERAWYLVAALSAFTAQLGWLFALMLLGVWWWRTRKSAAEIREQRLAGDPAAGEVMLLLACWPSLVATAALGARTVGLW